MQYNSFFATTLTVLLVLVLAGCSDPDARYSKVEGTITYNGAPLADATVSFAPTSSEGEYASGLTDASGKFMLTSAGAIDGGRGALPGDYTVTVSKMEAAVDKDQEDLDSGKITYDEYQAKMAARGSYASAPAAKSLIPQKYGSGSSSGLTATVEKGKNQPFVFDLVD